MGSKFVFVFSERDRDKMLGYGYELIRYDERNGIYVFFNNNKSTVFDSVHMVYSDTMTF